jgi:hypothetical protein
MELGIRFSFVKTSEFQGGFETSTPHQYATVPVQDMYPQVVPFMARLSPSCHLSLCTAVWLSPTHIPVQYGHSTMLLSLSPPLAIAKCCHCLVQTTCPSCTLSQQLCALFTHMKSVCTEHCFDFVNVTVEYTVL